MGVTCVSVNMNDYVRIKLTPLGRSILADQDAKTAREFPYLAKHLTSPKEDADGYSEWQLWYLANRLGPYLMNGLDVPFETDILLARREAPRG